MPATKVTIQGGGFQDAEGHFLTGTLVLRLSQAAAVVGVGKIAQAPISIAVTAGSAAPTDIWGVDNLTPAGLTYSANFFDSSRGLLWRLGTFSPTGTGTIDLATLTS